MSDRQYSRLYWEVMDDVKFDGIREDPRHFGTWALLLVVADMAWPASAFVPPLSPKRSLALLAERELVDLLPGGRYRIHGLDRERDARSEKARAAVASRWNGRSAPVERPKYARITPDLLAENETRKDEERRDETTGAGDTQLEDILDGPLAYCEVTTRYPQPGSDLHRWTSRLADEYGAPTFQSALASEFIVSPTMKDLLSRTEARLAKEADRNRKAARQEATPKRQDMTPEQRAEYDALRARFQQGGLA